MSEKQDPASKALLQELAIVRDVPLRVSIEVGRVKVSIREFMRFSPGSILELKRPAGEPFEIAINGHVVGKGEVVMVEQSCGVRIVEILKPRGVA